ncbi:hypothetical protein BGW41_003713 [Actinomortierella wolfii]|nr:hypothetical protein BGW41_003713 [Actinomortierella wolfii]
MRQFGTEQDTMTEILVNGTVYLPYNVKFALMSPKFYSITGEVKGRQWVTTRATTKFMETGSPWLALDLGWIEPYPTDSHFYKEDIGQKPAPDALLSIGTYSPAADWPVFGKLIVFDASGTKGVVYITVSDSNNQTLATPTDINMNNITLTKAAYSITMGATGYIIDEAPDHSTVLYSITPNSTATPTLYPVTVNGNVPRFIPGRASTTMGSNKLLLFGGLQDDKPTSLFHAFDTSTRTWSGLNLVSPYVPESTKTNNIAAIVGGVVGGVVLLALLSFFGFRRWRTKRHRVVIPNRDSDLDPLKGQEAVVMTDISQQPQHHHQLPPVVPASPLHQQHQHISAYYDPNARVPESEQAKLPLIFQPSVSVEQPQATIYVPHGVNSTIDYSPPLASIYQSNGSPSTSSQVYAERGSTLSPATVYSIQASVPTQPGAPQLIPDGPIRDTP